MVLIPVRYLQHSAKRQRSQHCQRQFSQTGCDSNLLTIMSPAGPSIEICQLRVQVSNCDAGTQLAKRSLEDTELPASGLGSPRRKRKLEAALS